MRRSASLSAITIWIALGCACACGTHRAYQGPAREPGAVARLETFREQRVHIFLDAIDGDAVPIWNDRAEVLPGSHVLEASVVIRLRDKQLISTHLLPFEAEAGRVYRVEAGLGFYGPGVWITDVESQRVIAEAVTLPDDLPPVGSRDY